LGSRNRNGNVPNVNWNADNSKIHINWYNPDNVNANDNLRARQKSPTKKSRFIRDYLFKYFIHPLAILEICIIFSSNERYFLSVIIFNPASIWFWYHNSPIFTFLNSLVHLLL